MHIKTRKTLQKEIDLLTFILDEAKAGDLEAIRIFTRITEIDKDIGGLKRLKKQRSPFSRIEIHQDLKNLEFQKKYLIKSFDVQKRKARKYLSEIKRKKS